MLRPTLNQQRFRIWKNDSVDRTGVPFLSISISRPFSFLFSHSRSSHIFRLFLLFSSSSSSILILLFLFHILLFLLLLFLIILLFLRSAKETRLNPFARSWFYNATAVRGALWWFRQSHSVNYANHQHSPFARRRHDVANSIFPGIVW